MNFSDPNFLDHVDTFTRDVCAAVRRDPAHYMNVTITPFVTPRDLMHSVPPSRWRVLARRAWFARLRRRVARELAHQHAYASRFLAVVRAR